METFIVIFIIALGVGLLGFTAYRTLDGRTRNCTCNDGGCPHAEDCRMPELLECLKQVKNQTAANNK